MADRSADGPPVELEEHRGGGIEITWPVDENEITFRPTGARAAAALRHILQDLHTIRLVLVARDGTELAFENQDDIDQGDIEEVCL